MSRRRDLESSLPFECFRLGKLFDFRLRLFRYPWGKIFKFGMVFDVANGKLDIVRNPLEWIARRFLVSRLPPVKLRAKFDRVSDVIG